MCLSWTLQYILTEVLGPQQHPVPLPALKDALVPASQPAAIAPKMPVQAAPRETNAEPSVPGPASASVSSAHVPLAPGPSGKGKASAGLQLAVGYHDDQQKVWNGTCWSVSWKPAGDGSKYTDPAVAIFPDGSEYICTDILQGELTEKGVFQQRASKRLSAAAGKKSEKDYSQVGTHSDGDIGDLYVTTRSDGDKMQFACLLNGRKKQICQVSSKNAPLEHGLTIMTKLGEYMLSNPSVTARGFQQPFKCG